MNRQKTIHGDERPSVISRGRQLNLCHCGAWYSLPMCQAARHKSCSAKCKADLSARRIEESKQRRQRACAYCGAKFAARSWLIDNGFGRYCSISCSSSAFANSAAGAERSRKIRATLAEGRAAGRIKGASQPKGPDSPFWKGGAEATIQRQRDRGGQRNYRRANPDKRREWSQRRSSRKIGRLPRGTVASLRERQRNRCAICACSIAEKFHVDHIMPLALGGKHEPLNIQLLCPTCNVRKNAKHPIRYAQERGMLL